MAWYTAVNARDTSDATASNNDIRKGKTAYVNNKLVTGTMPEKDAATYTPSTRNQIINDGVYLSGDQTIKGDSNLIADNIIRKKSIFGVEGNQIPIEYDDQVKIMSGITHTTIKYNDEKILTSFNKNNNTGLILTVTRWRNDNPYYGKTNIYGWKLNFTYISLDNYSVISNSSFGIPTMYDYIYFDTDSISTKIRSFNTILKNGPIISSVLLDDNATAIVTTRGITNYVGSEGALQNITKFNLQTGEIILAESILDPMLNHSANAINIIKRIGDNLYYNGPATQPGLAYLSVESDYTISPYSAKLGGYILYSNKVKVSTEQIPYYTLTESYNSSLNIYEPKISEKKFLPAYSWKIDNRYNSYARGISYINCNYFGYLNGYYYFTLNSDYGTFIKTTDFVNFEYCKFTEEFGIEFSRNPVIGGFISDINNNKLLLLSYDDHRFGIYDGNTKALSYSATFPYYNNTGINGYSSINVAAFDGNKTFVLHFSADNNRLPDDSKYYVYDYIFTSTDYLKTYTKINFKEELLKLNLQINGTAAADLSYDTSDCRIIEFVNNAFYTFIDVYTSKFEDSYYHYLVAFKSVDGITWNNLYSKYITGELFSYFNRRHIAGDGNKTIVKLTQYIVHHSEYSKVRVTYDYSLNNGDTWSFQNSITTVNLYNNDRINMSIAYGNGKFVIATSQESENYVRIRYSTNGTSWSSTTVSITNTNETGFIVEYINDKFILMPEYGYRFFYSTNGTSWTASSVLYNTERFEITTIPYDFEKARSEITFNGSSYDLKSNIDGILYILPFGYETEFNSRMSLSFRGTMDGTSWYDYKYRAYKKSTTTPSWMGSTSPLDSLSQYVNGFVYDSIFSSNYPSSTVRREYYYYSSDGLTYNTWSTLNAVIINCGDTYDFRKVDVYYSANYSKYIIFAKIYNSSTKKYSFKMYYSSSIGGTLYEYNISNYISSVESNITNLFFSNTHCAGEDSETNRIFVISNEYIMTIELGSNGTSCTNLKFTTTEGIGGTDLFKYNNTYYTYSELGTTVGTSSDGIHWEQKSLDEVNIFKIINQGKILTYYSSNNEHPWRISGKHFQVSLGPSIFSNPSSNYSYIKDPSIYVYDNNVKVEYLISHTSSDSTSKKVLAEAATTLYAYHITRNANKNKLGLLRSSTNLLIFGRYMHDKFLILYIHPKTKSGNHSSLYKANNSDHSVIDDSPNDYIDGDVIDIVQISETKYITVNKRRLLSTALGVEYARPMEYLINYYSRNEGKPDTKQNTITISINPTDYTFKYLRSIYSSSYIYTTFLRSDNKMIRYCQSNNIESSLIDISASSISGVTIFNGALVTPNHIYVIHTNKILQKIKRSSSGSITSIWKFTIPQLKTDEVFTTIDIDYRGNIWCISQYRTVLIVESVGFAYLKSIKNDDPAYIATNNSAKEYNELYDIFYIYD